MQDFGIKKRCHTSYNNMHFLFKQKHNNLAEELAKEVKEEWMEILINFYVCWISCVVGE